MRTFKKILALITFAVKRLYTQKWLTLASVFGIVTVLTLILSIPLYADAVNYQILNDEFSVKEERSNLPAFSFLFFYPFTQSENVNWEDIEPINDFFDSGGVTSLGLPVLEKVRYFRTNNFKVYSSNGSGSLDLSDSHVRMSFAIMQDVFDHITLVSGSFPNGNSQDPEVIPVLISESFALEYGFQVGDRYIAYIEQETNGVQHNFQVEVEVSGIWQPTDETETYWFFGHGVLEKGLLVSEDVFINRVSSLLNNEIYVNGWYFKLDGDKFYATDVDPFLFSLRKMENKVDGFLPGTSLNLSPKDALERYKENVEELTFFLYVVSIPIMGLLLVFINLVVSLTSQNRQNQMAVLRSRGATLPQLLGVVVIESVILGLISLGLALPIGIVFAGVLGNVKSFMDFSSGTFLRIGIDERTINLGLAAVLALVILQVLPAIGNAQYTIVSYKQSQARSLRPPFWKRVWLDIILLIPTLYGGYVLTQQGSVGIGEGIEVFDPFQNPLLILFPAFGILAVSLFILRILPWFMALISWVLSKTRVIGAYMAIRQLSRTPQFYSAPLILLILTLSLSTFSATMAQTLDRALVDQQYYMVGADMHLVEMGFNAASLSGFNLAEGQSDDSDIGTQFFYLPVQDNLKIQDVDHVARVGEYAFSADLSGGFFRGDFYGIDRGDFPKVAFWREDFSSQGIVDLMNELAVNPNGVLVDQEFLDRNLLNIGDSINVKITNGDSWVEYPVKIVGTVNYFPTWYPIEGENGYNALMVGNLEYYFEQIGLVYTYEVWAETSEKTDYRLVVKEANQMGLGVMQWDAPQLAIDEEQRRPDRQGLFGVLSVGFLAAAVLTVLGFMIYWIFSFRRRFVELGVLQAVGLSPNQMMSFLGWELIIITFVGGLFGTVLGVAVSNFFIPFLQLGEGESVYPPFLIEISWAPVFRIYILFGLLFVVAFAVLVILLRRMKIFQALKLGETV